MKMDDLFKTDAVLWKNPVPDGYGGYTYDSPIQIKVRWEDVQRWYRDKDGVEKLSDSIVFYTDKIEVGEKLARGNLSDASESDSRKVDRCKECKNVKDEVVMWMFWLL